MPSCRRDRPARPARTVSAPGRSCRQRCRSLCPRRALRNRHWPASHRQPDAAGGSVNWCWSRPTRICCPHEYAPCRYPDRSGSNTIRPPRPPAIGPLSRPGDHDIGIGTSWDTQQIEAAPRGAPSPGRISSMRPSEMRAAVVGDDLGEIVQRTERAMHSIEHQSGKSDHGAGAACAACSSARPRKSDGAIGRLGRVVGGAQPRPRCCGATSSMSYAR